MNTTEKIIEMLENDLEKGNTEEFIRDCRTLFSWDYTKDIENALMTMAYTYYNTTKMLEKQIDIAEKNIVRLGDANTELVNKLQKIHLESILD